MGLVGRQRVSSKHRHSTGLRDAKNSTGICTTALYTVVLCAVCPRCVLELGIGQYLQQPFLVFRTLGTALYTVVLCYSPKTFQLFIIHHL